MADLTIYHNPRCSKSRQALALLQEQGRHPEIVEYLKTPLDTVALKKLLDQLSLRPRDILRSSETEYEELGLESPHIGDDKIIAAIAKHPKLMQRPIVVKGDRAAIGRPIENILSLLAEADE